VGALFFTALGPLSHESCALKLIQLRRSPEFLGSLGWPSSRGVDRPEARTLISVGRYMAPWSGEIRCVGQVTPTVSAIATPGAKRVTPAHARNSSSGRNLSAHHNEGHSANSMQTLGAVATFSGSSKCLKVPAPDCNSRCNQRIHGDHDGRDRGLSTRRAKPPPIGRAEPRPPPEGVLWCLTFRSAAGLWLPVHLEECPRSLFARQTARITLAGVAARRRDPVEQLRTFTEGQLDSTCGTDVRIGDTSSSTAPELAMMPIGAMLGCGAASFSDTSPGNASCAT
jgi:hypothetical protein